MTQNRTFDEGRKAQGFRDQAHLDGFYAYYDHTTSCADCAALVGRAWVDDGYMDTRGDCDTAKALYRESL
jgi:hypothetical protein